jgi:hypothetical protein
LFFRWLAPPHHILDELLFLPGEMSARLKPIPAMLRHLPVIGFITAVLSRLRLLQDRSSASANSCGPYPAAFASCNVLSRAFIASPATVARNITNNVLRSVVSANGMISSRRGS